MIRLNISTSCKQVQFWARGRRTNVAMIDVDGSEFQTQSFRSASSSVYIELSVNGLVRGFILSDFPPVNDDDDDLNLNEVTCILRLWSGKLMEHISLTWNMMRSQRTKYEHCTLECLEWSGVGTVCSANSIIHTNKWLYKMVSDAYPRTLLRPNYYISGEVAFNYVRGERLVSEEWLKELLLQATRALSTTMNTTEELQTLLSFMFFSNIPCPNDHSLSTIDAILSAPSTRSDVVCRAYHILMSLIFSDGDWQDPDLCALKRKIVLLGGFPYAAWTRNGFVLVLIPQDQVQTIIGSAQANSSTSMMIPLTDFSMESPQGLEKILSKRGIRAFQQSPPMGAVTHILGNAHMMSNPNLQLPIAFKTKNQREFVADQSQTLSKELELFNVHKGIINTLSSHPTQPPPSDEMTYYTVRKSMEVKCIYRVEPFKESFDHLEQELDKMGYEMDIMYSSSASSWIMRVGAMKGGFW